MNQKGSPCCLNCLTVISSYHSKVTVIDSLDPDEITEVVLLYVFEMAFPASLFKLGYLKCHMLFYYQSRDRSHSDTAVHKGLIKTKKLLSNKFCHINDGQNKSRSKCMQNMWRWESGLVVITNCDILRKVSVPQKGLNTVQLFLG